MSQIQNYFTSPISLAPILFCLIHTTQSSSQESRILPNAVGDWIENVSFLPVTVNVPDVLGGMANFVIQALPFGGQQDEPRWPKKKKPLNDSTDKKQSFNFSKLSKISQVKGNTFVPEMRKRNKKVSHPTKRKPAKTSEVSEVLGYVIKMLSPIKLDDFVLT